MIVTRWVFVALPALILTSAKGVEVCDNTELPEDTSWQLLQTGSQVHERHEATGNHFRGVVLSAGGYVDSVVAAVGPWVGRIIQYKAQASRPLEWAIMLERSHEEKIKQVYPNFHVAFSKVLHPEDARKDGSPLKMWSSHMANSGDCRADAACMAHVKSMKINAVRLSPFQETLYMDAETMTCRPDFSAPLFDLLYGGSQQADIAIQPQLLEQLDAADSTNASARSWFSDAPFEHNSGMMVFRKTPATSYLLSTWSQKFHEGDFASDQPTLQLAIEQTSRTHGLVLRHIPINTFCRRGAAARMRCGAGCAAVYLGDDKPLESFGSKVILVGYEHTGSDLLKNALQSFWGESHSVQEQAEKSFLSGEAVESWLYKTLRDVNGTQSASKLILQDAPWDIAPTYRRAAEAFPRALFVLATRDADSWWKSVECHISKDKTLAEKYQKELQAPSADRDAMIGAFNDYNAAVVDYFEKTLQQRRLITADVEKDGGVAQFIDNFCQNYVGCKTDSVMQMVKQADTTAKDECGM